MRAVVLRSHGGPEVLTIEEVPDPNPGPDEVLVDVRCHRAEPRPTCSSGPGYYPNPACEELEIPGLELAGTVAAHRARASPCGSRRRGDGPRRRRRVRRAGAVHERQLIAVPAVGSVPTAAAVPEVFLTAWDALVVQGGLTVGRWALVPRRRVRCGHRGDPDRQGGRRPHRGHLLGREGGGAAARLGADVVLERSPNDWLTERRVPPSRRASTPSSTWSAATRSTATCRRVAVEGPHRPGRA